MDCLLSVEADVHRAKTSFSRLQSSIHKELNDDNEVVEKSASSPKLS